MTIDKDDLINSIMSSLDRIENTKSSDLPNIELYMDQVTSLMNKRLKATARNPEEDKILTKTMINNYAKNDLIPPPEKKKYTKEHLILLIFIYYSKGFLSITDIQDMLRPITEKYFGSDKDMDLCDIYDEVFSTEKIRKEEIKDDILKKYEKSHEMFYEAEGEDKELLQMFSFIFMLGFDVYVKKLLIEKLIDTYTGFSDDTEDKDSKKNKK